MASCFPGALPVQQVARSLFAVRWWLTLFCFGYCLATVRAEQPTGTPPLSADEIVRRSVLRDDQLRASRTTMKSDRTVHTDRLDAGGKVIETKTVRAVHYPTNGMDVSTEVESTRAADATGENTVKADKLETVMSLRRLAPRFDMTLLGEETVRGQACYIIGYRPKSVQPSASTREEKVVGNLHGRLWLSKTDFSIIQSEGALVGPVTLALVASVNQMDFKYHSQSLPNGDTAPSDLTMSMAIKAPFYDFRQRQVTTEENWRPR